MVTTRSGNSSRKERLANIEAPDDLDDSDSEYYESDIDIKPIVKPKKPVSEKKKQGKPNRKRKYVAPENTNPNIPHYVSRPRNRHSMFMEFNKNYRKKIIKENPDLENLQVSKMVSQAYRKLSPEEKEALRQKCADLREVLKPAKLPPTGFVMFSRERQPEFKKMFPDASFADLSHMVGTLWRASDPELRETYQERSRVAREKFRAEQKQKKMAAKK